jgi:hypothetical protein
MTLTGPTGTLTGIAYVPSLIAEEASGWLLESKKDTVPIGRGWP